MDFNTAYNNYYAILNSSYRTKDMVINDLPESESESLVNDTNDLINTFLSMVKTLHDFERQKEEFYLKTWLKKLSNATTQEGRLVDILEPLIIGPEPNFTQAFQIIELWRQGFITEVESMEQIYRDWRDEFDQFSNKVIMQSANSAIKELGNNIATLTPKQMLDTVVQRIESDWAKGKNKQSKENFYHFLSEFSPYLTKIVSEMRDFRDVWDSDIDLQTVYKVEKQSEVGPLVMSKVITGLVNGLPHEMMLVAFGKGASTARATRVLQFLNGKSMNVATETDVYAILDNNLMINEAAVKKIANFEQDKDIQALLESSDLNKNFIIHYSSKDLTIAESRGSSGAVAKIKGEGGFSSKITGLEEIGRAANEEKSVHDLIFKAINVGKDLLYDGNKGLIDRISTGLTALAFAFMFDDFERQFDRIRNETHQTNTELNLYAISGNYYPASDILTVLYNYVLNLQKNGYSTKKSFINISFKPSKIRAYDEVYLKKVEHFQGQELWREVRDAVAADAKMSVRMQTKYLKDIMFAIQSPQLII